MSAVTAHHQETSPAMSATLTARSDVGSDVVDNRLAYALFAFAYVFGHGLNAVSFGGATFLPPWLSWTLLAAGFAAGTVVSTVTAVRAQRSMAEPARTSARLLGAAWVTGFTGLFFVITGLSVSTGAPDLQLVLWPTGSALVVGLITIAEGSLRRDRLHYALGTLLTVLGGVALMLPPLATLVVMTVGGGGAYVLAVFLAYRRHSSSPAVLEGRAS